MAEIFPSEEHGGVPPGTNVVNGYTPVNQVIGEGPLYAASECTTIFSAEQINSITSEILAAVDKLGSTYNTDRLTNLGDAITQALTSALDQAVSVDGDTMTGPLVLNGDPTEPNGAATKQYADTKVSKGGDTMHGPLVLQDDPTQPKGAATKQYVDANVGPIITAYQARDAELQTDINTRVLRAGDQMTGALILAKHPDLDFEAATKAYVDTHAGSGGGGGGGGIPEAPNDSLMYGRASTNWSRAVALAGDTMTGDLTITKNAPALTLNGGATAASFTLNGMDVSLSLNATAAALETIKGKSAHLNLNHTDAGEQSILWYSYNGKSRWAAYSDNATETGGNTGSRYIIGRYDDVGTFMDAPLVIYRLTGDVVMSHALQVGSPLPPMATGSVAGDAFSLGVFGMGFNCSLNAAGSQWLYRIAGYAGNLAHDAANGVLRWYGAASGAAGAGVPLTPKMELNNNGDFYVTGKSTANGEVTSLGGNLVAQALPGANAHVWFRDSTGANKGILYYDAANNRYVMTLSSTGAVAYFSGNGAFSVSGGYQGKQGIGGGFSSVQNNMFYTGGVMQLWADATNMGNIYIPCDYRIKKDVADLPSTWDAVKKLRPIKHTQAEFSPPSQLAYVNKMLAEATEGTEVNTKPLFEADDIERWGFIAHELQETLIPSAAGGVKDAPDEIQSPNLLAVVAALTKALQEAMARIEALEAR